MIYSAISSSARDEMQDLLSRFFHHLQHGQDEFWSDLFVQNARITWSGNGVFNGLAEISVFLGCLQSASEGRWRYQLFGTVFERGTRHSAVEARSCLMIHDCGKQGISPYIYDCIFDLKCVKSWRIAGVSATAAVNQVPAIFCPLAADSALLEAAIARDMRR